MSHSDSDAQRMREAMVLAESAIGVSDPNPRVGCVIAESNGRTLGLGSTQQAGGPHAEVMALRDAQAAGNRLQGATAWVTLEPCAHHGRTPPCCDALIAAGIRRVVIAVEDPFPQVAGAGIERMRAAGIEVSVMDGPCAESAIALNIGYFSRVLRGRPWVRLKVAASLDGRTALSNGGSQWITGTEARADGHRWRRRAGAVLTGIGTVVADDPRLDVRLVPTTLQPLRVVVDSRARLALDARLLEPPGQVLVVTSVDDPASARSLRARGAEVIQLGSPEGQVDLPGLLAELGRRGVNELHVEAGETLNAALLRADLVDEWLIYMAPLLIGRGRGIAAGDALTDLSEAMRMQFIECSPCGPDLRLRSQLPGRAGFTQGTPTPERAAFVTDPST
jgi:diaminohydroxyphosphoribosylaminopyrimidine deaminase/5-amino-6-(5-phosphoribosylamino)uracil reductase